MKVLWKGPGPWDQLASPPANPPCRAATGRDIEQLLRPEVLRQHRQSVEQVRHARGCTHRSERCQPHRPLHGAPRSALTSASGSNFKLRSYPQPARHSSLPSRKDRDVRVDTLELGLGVVKGDERLHLAYAVAMHIHHQQ